jgi:hypothetical protein
MLQVEIRIRGRIDRRWSEWFNDLTIAHTNRDETILTGSVADYTALYGVIARLRDLGLPLTSVNALEESARETSPCAISSRRASARRTDLE